MPEVTWSCRPVPTEGSLFNSFEFFTLAGAAKVWGLFYFSFMAGGGDVEDFFFFFFLCR